ncbi:uroporphyrinogen-III C-methyltransferase [Noviherbaspirillum soli]|uniref:uroporphyrinogen-III C-methyltransferase n=1 Tax=Noviherbaspirillum soli TaxID=1064518 RepID=UPI00188CA1A8
MNEPPYNPDLPQPPHLAAGTADPMAPYLRNRNGRIGYVLLAVLALLLALQWWSNRSELRQLRREMAQRLQTGDTMATESRAIARTVQDDVKELQAKVSVLENKQVEGQSQQLALEQLYQELSRNSDDWALAEIEQVLSTASQQLQLAGNVQGALIALQNADTRLSRSDKPQFITIRRALARDMEKLKALPSVDVTGIALRLDSLISQVDRLPLLSDEKPALPATPAKNHAAAADGKPAPAPAWIGALSDKWQSFSSEMWTEIRQLLRVRTVDTPDALMLSPSQAYYVRENLKLRLLSARLALLSRNENAFRSDLMAAQDTINRYFDTRARQTQSAQTLLKQVQASDLTIEMPTLNESIGAVRNYKSKP